MADQKAQRFTFDAEKDGAEVPTLTSLLYRKNVVKTEGSPKGGAAPNGYGKDSGIQSLEVTMTMERPLPTANPPQPISTEDPTGISLLGIASGDATGLIHSQFNSATSDSGLPLEGASGGAGKVIRAAGAKTTPLSVVSPDFFATSSGPSNGAGIRDLAVKAKMNSALVYQRANAESFKVVAIVGGEKATDRSSLWTGMEFSTKEFGDLWGRLEKFGFAEYSTLGAAGQGNVDRSAFRTAFGAKGNEWVTLVRGKSVTGEDTFYAFLSEASLQVHLPSLHSAGMSSVAKAA